MRTFKTAWDKYLYNNTTDQFTKSKHQNCITDVENKIWLGIWPKKLAQNNLVTRLAHLDNMY